MQDLRNAITLLSRLSRSVCLLFRAVQISRILDSMVALMKTARQSVRVPNQASRGWSAW